ncbi:MAG: 16S rRNA (adenine(1518)-N(6)/adenine(1519)-N(6))-dimethyltransferase RsmA [Candidatus Wolfebacteria bacterium]|nr:16S rRNA (adenine(1518)-N(6)/adenine(1519)-N(6))-dimethyltransferase RsmA [Candidatus Wolfebacteria bacterium]
MSRKLGQHFLVNKNKIQKIVEALELKKGDVVVEIGPGHGELTTEIRNNKLENRIIAIEKDKILANGLREKFKDNNNIEIIEGDALKILTDLTYNSKLTTNNYKLTGNIPYYITGSLLRILSELENKPLLIVLTIQKEVAQRICAKPPQMNLLAAITQFWTEPKIIEYISKNDFRPIPKVDSAIIRLTTYNPEGKQASYGAGQQFTTEEAEKYYKFVKVLFKQPRKTIINNLRDANILMHTNYTNKKIQLKKEEIIGKFQMFGINPQDRPQNLSLEQIKHLSTLF